MWKFKVFYSRKKRAMTPYLPWICNGRSPVLVPLVGEPFSPEMSRFVRHGVWSF